MRASPDVTKLLGRVALLSALVLGSFGVLYFGPFPYKHQLAMLIDKRVMLNSRPAPRVILVGGSGLFFGVDSELLTQSLGVRVVNMGVFGGLGILAPLEVIRPHIRHGDIVVLVPEYALLFTSLSPFQKDYYRWFLAVDPKAAWRLYYSHEKPRVLMGDFLLLVRDKVAALFAIPIKGNHSLARNGYMRYLQVVNRYGDGSEEIRPSPPENLVGRNTIYQHDALKPEVIEQLNDVARRLEERGARVVLTFGVYPEGEYDLSRKVIDVTAERLRSEGQFTVLGRPQDFLYPYSAFSDTVNHVQAPARAARTRRLAELLAEAGVGSPGTAAGESGQTH
ncbi:MAG: hypothetical protein ABW205_02005 [Burkholderiales bacterium]